MWNNEIYFYISSDKALQYVLHYPVYQRACDQEHVNGPIMSCMHGLYVEMVQKDRKRSVYSVMVIILASHNYYLHAICSCDGTL